MNGSINAEWLLVEIHAGDGMGERHVVFRGLNE
jgi:hypothetical protein